MLHVHYDINYVTLPDTTVTYINIQYINGTAQIRWNVFSKKTAKHYIFKSNRSIYNIASPERCQITLINKIFGSQCKILKSPKKWRELKQYIEIARKNTLLTLNYTEEHK